MVRFLLSYFLGFVCELYIDLFLFLFIMKLMLTIQGPGHGIQLSSGRLIVPGNVFWKPPADPGKSISFSLSGQFHGKIATDEVLLVLCI